VVALVPAERLDDVVDPAVTRYRAETGLTPMPLVVRAVDGAGVVA
jgi:hypothetical protein